MSLTRPYEHIYYIGNGSTRTFSYIFDAINADFVSVSIKHTDGTITDNVNVIVDKDQAQHLIGTITFEPQDTPEIGSIIRITRKTPIEQATQYSRSISFNSKNIETSFDLVVAMIQELQDKFTNSSLNQNIFQDEPFSIDFINPEDDGASLVIDYQTKLIKKGLYFKIESGNLHVSSDGVNWIMMPKSTEIQEFRQKQLQNPTRLELEYRIGTTWFLAGSSASAIATEALNKATEALETANDAKETAESIDSKATQALENSIEALNKSESAEQTADEAKDIAQDASDAVSAHITDTDNPHSVTKAQVGLGNVDNTSDADKPISTATQDALDLKTNSADLGTAAYTDSTDYATVAQGTKADSALQPGNNVSELVNDTGFITKAVNDLQNYTLTSDLATVATSGSYTDLSNTPTIPTTLAELTGDVSISSPSGGEHLVYDAVAGKWKNTPSAATVSWGGIAGDINNQSDLMALFATKADVSVTYTKTEVDNLLVEKADVATTLAGYGISDAYTKTETDDALNLKQDEATAVNYDNISNCITEIPQDIKLELNNGELTLKAGSKVYIPNGPGVFDIKITDHDIATTYTPVVGTGKYLVCVNYELTHYAVSDVNGCVSGPGITPISGGMCYDTTTNIIQRWVGSTVLYSKTSFPLAVVTATNSVITSIDQVFNGFGYIGKTVFALPGVKGLIPNGRNADGSLKNTEFSISSVLTRTFTTHNTTYGMLGINPSVPSYFGLSNYVSYDEQNNIVLEGGVEWDFCIIGYASTSNGTITYFNINTAFHALDYNDREYIAHQAMPSDRYVDLTLPASGQSITAPADGWLFLNKTVGTTNTRIEMWNSATNFRTVTPTGGLSTSAWAYCSIPANRGNVIQVVYTVTGTTNAFRFVYPNGAQ